MQFSTGFLFAITDRSVAPFPKRARTVCREAESVADFHDNVTSLTNGRNSPLLTSNRSTKSSTATDIKTNQRKMYENRTQQNQEAVRKLIVSGLDIGGGINVSDSAQRARANG